MEQSNSDTTNEKTRVQCLEVLISKSEIVKSNDNLFWTLSVYSLENQPVRRNRTLHNSEIFHFMVYDWERTIKTLLEAHQVPYSIIQFFSPETIYMDAPHGDIDTQDHEAVFLHALENLPGTDVSVGPEDAPTQTEEKLDALHLTDT